MDINLKEPQAKLKAEAQRIGEQIAQARDGTLWTYAKLIY